MSWRWWEQDELDLKRSKNRAEKESGGEEAQSEEEGLGKEDTTGRE